MTLSKRERQILKMMLDGGTGPQKRIDLDGLVAGLKVKAKSQKNATKSVAGSMRWLQMKLQTEYGVVLQRITPVGRGNAARYAFRSKEDVDTAKTLIKH